MKILDKFLCIIFIINLLIVLLFLRRKSVAGRFHRITISLLVVINILIAINFLTLYRRNIVSRISGSSSIFCIILTKPDAFKTDRIKTVYDVWARKCDDYRFLSVIPQEFNNTNSLNITKESIEVLEPYKVLQPIGYDHESYGLLTLKIFGTFRFLYQEHGGYDWYLKCDHDTYINIENMREFLYDKDPSLPVTYGSYFSIIVNKGYHSGGGGYLLSNEAFNRIGGELSKNASFCRDTGIEDTDVAICLRKLEVYPDRSHDALFRERFHSLNIWTHYFGPIPGWLFHYSDDKRTLQTRENCCSDRFISFHYMKAKEMIMLDNAIRMEVCLKDDYLDYRCEYRGQNISFTNVMRNYVFLKNIDDKST